MNINNKLKQFSQGNWGKPNKTEQAQPIHFDILEDEVPKHGKRKPRTRKVYLPYGSECPFCHGQLAKVEEKDPKYKDSVLRWFHTQYAKECICGAYEVQDCPSCHRKTWHKDKIFKHQYHGCGFEGKRKQ